MTKIKFILYTFVIFFINLAIVNAAQPNWINNSDEECAKNEICATGSGTSSSLSKAEARNNILRYFEISINSKFSSTISSNEETVKNFTSDDLEELSEGILKGVKIKFSYKDEDAREFFAFAVLNKDIATKEVKDDIEKLDSKMKLLIAEKNIKYTKQLEKLYVKRSELNKRYLILTGNMIPEVVKYEDIFRIKKAKSENGLIFFVEISSDNEKDAADYLANSLLDNGAVITLNEKDANRIVHLTLRRTDMYLKVDGFVKQKYSLKIESKGMSGKTEASLYEEFIETGRDDKQIRDLVDIKIKDYILDNIGSLLQ